MNTIIIGLIVFLAVTTFLMVEARYRLNQLKIRNENGDCTIFRPAFRDLTSRQRIGVAITSQLAMNIEQAYSAFKSSWLISGEANLLEPTGLPFEEIKRVEILKLSLQIIGYHDGIILSWWNHRKVDDLPWVKVGNRAG